jgi:hypothetical protein
MQSAFSRMHGTTKSSIYYRPTLSHVFSVYKEGALPYDTALCLRGQMLGGGCAIGFFWLYNRRLADCAAGRLFTMTALGQE